MFGKTLHRFDTLPWQSRYRDSHCAEEEDIKQVDIEQDPHEPQDDNRRPSKWRPTGVLGYLLLSFTLLLVVANISRLRSDQTQYLLDSSTAHSTTFPFKDNAPSEIDWSQFAYSQYATNFQYLCNSVMIFESLHRLGSKASRFLMYPQDWTIDEANPTAESRLLTKARDEYKVDLVPIEVQHFLGEPTWAESFTKLLAFNQTQYKRVISLDSDAVILQPMDELFHLPQATVALPRAYWLEQPYLTTVLMVIEPSTTEFLRIRDAFHHRAIDDFDMEIVNTLYGDKSLIIPHRRYALLTQEFRSKEHGAYLGPDSDEWDPYAILNETKYLHFSDWPLPKPWRKADKGEKERLQPDCDKKLDARDRCRDRDVWNAVYADFKDRRAKVCNVRE